MIKTKDIEDNQSENSTVGIVAGATGGTLLVFIADTFFQNDSNFRAFLLYLAPSFSVLSTAFILWIKEKISVALKMGELDGIIKNAKMSLEKVKNSSTNAEHLSQLQHIVEDLEKIKFESYKGRVEFLKQEIEKV